ncbi:MAG TPA: PP2C family protein-serine/threonine phosphatase [Candidatus Sulfopaludibacter sp.]|nr:PP2C family protein-serine/threonine phosphatase [Candidatus Sulfopaludibacter sp.]
MGTGAYTSEHSGDVYQLACLEIRGGNRRAVYDAELPGLNAWISCRPLLPATSGGDLYYLSVCAQGSISRVTIADVAGHGEGVSGVAEHLRDALREHVDEWDQSALIRGLNDGLLKGAGHAKFATAFVLSHYAATGEMLFTNAGHLPPLWYRARAGQWTFMEDLTPYSKDLADLPLGMIPGTDYRQTAVQLGDGDIVLLYTDGLSEAEDGEGEQLGLGRLLELTAALPTNSPAAAGQALLNAVARHRGGAPASDDETVVALRRHPVVPHRDL